MPTRTGAPDWTALRARAASCRQCDLWARATQTVFGEGALRPRIMLVGEQPGHEEDLAGHPFVGPAGRLLDHALDRAGIPRRTVYVTNVVKHFKWEPRGTRRIHQRPNAREVAACRNWIDAEIATLRPHAILCLGATAARALLGPAFRLTAQRGTAVESTLAPVVMATLHPSAVLRMRDEAERHAATTQLVADLRRLSRATAARERRGRV